MPYGTIKVDTITFTAGGVDTNVSISGLVQNPTFSGNITTTGNITGANVIGTTTVSGATVTGTTGNFAGTITAATVVGTTTVSGATVTGNTGSFATLTGGVTTITSGVFATGTAALPSISFTSDPNTGIYSPGADQVAISTNGTGRLFVDASGRVGIGTAPSSLLHLQVPSGSAQIQFKSGSNTDSYFGLDTAYNTGLDIASGGATTFRNFNGAIFSETLRITAAGLLGLGTSTVSDRLEISNGTTDEANALGIRSGRYLNAAQEGAQVKFYSDNTSSWLGTREVARIGAFGLASDHRVGSLAFALKTTNSASNPTELMRLTPTGLGIGTTEPNYNLHVTNGGGSGTLSLSPATTGGGASFLLMGNSDSGGATGPCVIYSANRALVFGVGTSFSSAGAGTVTDYLRIENNGRVGIGNATTGFGSNFIVGSGSGDNGATIYAGTSSQAYLHFADGNSGADRYRGGIVYNHSNNSFAFATNDTTAVTIDSSQRLLVGTSSSLSVAGGDRQVQIEGTSSSSLSMIQHSTSVGAAPLIVLGRSRGTANGSTTTVVNGDYLGYIQFVGANGSSFSNVGAEITAVVDGTVSGGGANDLPTRLVFSTTADGASSPTERLRLTAAGVFQSMPIYNTTGGDAANVVVNSAGTVYRSTSSAKYKTDIETLQNEFADAVLGLRPVWYRSTCAIDNPDWSYWGFIAEEVAEIDPRLVSWKTTEITYDERGSAIEAPCAPEPEGVQYDRFVPHLLNLIKRQGEAIAELQAEVAALKAS